MISFGITLQDKSNELPVEVAVWLLERNDCYPDVEFKVEYWDISDDDANEHENLRKQFSRLLHLRGRNDPLTVTCMYPRRNWHVRMIGDLTPEKRREIAQMPEDIVAISKDGNDHPTVGIPLIPEEVPNDHIELVPVGPHIYMSGLVMSGAELLDITTGHHTERKGAIMKAMSEKDWDTAKALLKQRH